MGMTPEGKVKAKFDAMVKATPAWQFSPQAGPFGRSGIPDRILCANGKFIGVEVKANSKKKPTALQLGCKKSIEAAGGKWFLVYDDATIAEVKDFIDACY